MVDRIWPRKSWQRVELRPLAKDSQFYEHVQLLAPKNEGQASAKAQLLAATLSLRKSYRLMFLQSEQTSITIPLLSVVTSWLVVIFFSFGIFAPRIPNVMFNAGHLRDGCFRCDLHHPVDELAVQRGAENFSRGDS
jgi:hypothetical protein